MSQSSVIVSDSGGIQEEAPSLGKAVLVTRENTERPEMLSTGLVQLVGSDRKAIVDRLRLVLNAEHRSPLVRNPCGDGKASIRILNFLEGILSN
jgi:UDP-N-acetylglucosamine 2-epimerase (non-hydrolysing)